MYPVPIYVNYARRPIILTFFLVILLRSPPKNLLKKTDLPVVTRSSNDKQAGRTQAPVEMVHTATAAVLSTSIEPTTTAVPLYCCTKTGVGNSHKVFVQKYLVLLTQVFHDDQAASVVLQSSKLFYDECKINSSVDNKITCLLYTVTVHQRTNATFERTILAPRAGHEVRVTNLYAEQFQPAMESAEHRGFLTAFGEGRVKDDVKGHVENLQWCSGLVLCYPTWWYSFPAILKVMDLYFVFLRQPDRDPRGHINSNV